MAIGDMAVATGSVASGGTTGVSLADFTNEGGNALTSSDAVIVRSIISENSITLNRTGTGFSIPITSTTGAAEIHSQTLIFNDVAQLQIADESSSSQNFALFAEQIDPANIFVTENSDLSDAGTLSRLNSTDGQEEYVIETASSGQFTVSRLVDANDDGTAELSADVETGATDTLTELWLASIQPSGRVNPLFETQITNTSGSSSSAIIIGTIV